MSSRQPRKKDGTPQRKGRTSSRPFDAEPRRKDGAPQRKGRTSSRPFDAEPRRKDGAPQRKGRTSSRPFNADRPRRKDRTPQRRSEPTTRTKTSLPSGNNIRLWGLHAARAAFLNPKRKITHLWLTDAGQKLFETTQNDARDELLKRPDAKKSSREEIDTLLPPNSVHQGIVIETAPLPEISLGELVSTDNAPSLILLLDQVTDPHNVGAILRSASAFGAGAVVMTERNAPASTGVLAKTASGALDTVPLLHVVNLSRAMDTLHDAGYWCVGLAEEGEKELSALDLSGRTALVLGSEGDGLRQLTRKKCDELARLPTQGAIGSLNVSNAAAVALYEVRRQIEIT